MGVLDDEQERSHVLAAAMDWLTRMDMVKGQGISEILFQVGMASIYYICEVMAQGHLSVSGPPQLQALGTVLHTRDENVAVCNVKCPDLHSFCALW